MPLPEIYQKWQERAQRAVRRVRIVPTQPSTVDEYEAGFRSYWMVAAWVILLYMCVTMGVIVVNMLQADALAHPYPWFAHLVGTSIIMGMLTITALVFRFVIFPLPGVIVQLDDIAASQPQRIGDHGGALVPAAEEQPRNGRDRAAA